MIIDKLDYCKNCIHRTNNLKDGVLCGLTYRKPNFGDTCKDFKEDLTRVNNEESLRKSKSIIKSKTSTWTILAISVSVVLIGFRAARLFSRFQEKNNSSEQYYSEYQNKLETYKKQTEKKRKRVNKRIEKERYHINTINYLRESKGDISFSKQLVKDTSFLLNDNVKMNIPKRFRITLANEDSELPLFANTRKYYLAVNKVKKKTGLLEQWQGLRKDLIDKYPTSQLTIKRYDTIPYLYKPIRISFNIENRVDTIKGVAKLAEIKGDYYFFQLLSDYRKYDHNELHKYLNYYVKLKK